MIETPKRPFYFTTRDLLINAVLAALGGVSSTYVNTIGDAAQAALGFPGATQWAAGLHTIWIVLAMGILQKTGTGTLIGIMKGAVELMSGNSHGVIILLINLVAGLLVDFVFFIFREKQSLVSYLIAGGLSAGSNVIIFQLFATLPTNLLAMSAIAILTVVAAISGIIFSGIIPFILVKQLIKANIIKRPAPFIKNRKIGWMIIMGVTILASLLTVYLKFSLQGPSTIEISGAVDNPIVFPDPSFSPELVSRQMMYQDLLTEYSGYQLFEILEYAQPSGRADTLLIEAEDGYAFLISFDELKTNPNILIVQQGQGQNATFNVVGPESSKAWVRNVSKMTVSESQGLVIKFSDADRSMFNPDDWLIEMDNTQVVLPSGSQKLQGVPLWKVLEGLGGGQQQKSIRVFSEQESAIYPWEEIYLDDNLRIFTVIEDEGLAFALGSMSGEVQLFPLAGIEIE